MYAVCVRRTHPQRNTLWNVMCSIDGTEYPCQTYAGWAKRAKNEHQRKLYAFGVLLMLFHADYFLSACDDWARLQSAARRSTMYPSMACKHSLEILIIIHQTEWNKKLSLLCLIIIIVFCNFIKNVEHTLIMHLHSVNVCVLVSKWICISTGMY